MERLTLLAIGFERALLNRVTKEISEEIRRLLPGVTVSLKYLKNYPSTFHPLVPGEGDRLIVLHLNGEDELEECLLVNRKILFVFLPTADCYKKEELEKLSARLLAYLEKDLVKVD